MIRPQDCHEGESREQRGRVSGGIGPVVHVPLTFTGHAEREVGVLPKRMFREKDPGAAGLLRGDG